MTGYPGDEHVFCVVGIVLARSPDCNSRSSGFSVSLRLCCKCVCATRVCSTFLDFCGSVKSSIVCLNNVIESVRVRQLIPNRLSTKSAAAVKQTASFSQLVSERGGRYHKRAYFELRQELRQQTSASISETTNERKSD